MPILVFGILMATFRNRPLPVWKPPSGAKGRSPPRVRDLRLEWGLFLLIGLPLGFMAALGPLASAGIYVEPLRQFWRPWPPDIVKPFIGVAGFVATLAYLTFRIGRNRGYRSGTVALTAAARNIAEGRGSALALEQPPETPRISPGLPAPPLEPPPAPPAP